MGSVLLLNGPNLNLLGQRELEKYGSKSLSKVVNEVRKLADDFDINLEDFQSNGEGELIDRIHKAKNDAVDYIIFNPGAYTHTSIALRDAMLGVSIPFIEVHISNIYQREKFRKKSYFTDIAVGSIVGFGSYGYLLAMNALVNKFGF